MGEEDLNRLTGKTVTVFTVDGNTFVGEVIKVNQNAVYITATEHRARMINISSITSILMGQEDAEQLMAIREKPIKLPSVPKKPIIVSQGDLPRF